MRRAVVAFLLALLLPAVLPGGRPGASAPAPLALFGGGVRPAEWAAPALVVEAYYRALRADEYVVVANPRDVPLDVSGWTITDQEGTLTFPAGSVIQAGSRATVAQNSTAYWEDTLRDADYRYGAGNATAMAAAGTLQLNNDGDEVILRDASGVTTDAFAYGRSPYSGPGWTGAPAGKVGSGQVARRAHEGGWRDTNGSEDWDLVRVWSLGQSEFAPASFDFTGTVRAFVSPDAQMTPLIDLIGTATESIDLSLYTLTHAALAGPLAAAASAGVRVRILLEGAPVGGIDEEEWDIVQDLASRAEIHFLTGNATLDVQKRYRFGHAKYGIVDNRTVILSTENWGVSAFPPAPLAGSRGWVVIVEHAPLAAYFAAVFEEDFDPRRRDVTALAGMTIQPVAPTADPTEARGPTFPPQEFSGRFRVLPVLGPETALSMDTIRGVLRSAAASIHVEMFYADATWGPFANLYLEELLAAARRGVAVRLLLDASSFNVEEDDPIDNDDTVAYVDGIAAAEGLDLQAKLVDLGAHAFTRMHTKGFVVDRRWTLVSSINWNRNSPTANREAGLLVENEELASYFDNVFAWDWKDDVTPPVADAGPDRTAPRGSRVEFVGLGSSDDHEVVNWSWDFEGDGTFDAWGPRASFVYRAAGAFALRLRVSDTWGNAAEDTARVVVTNPNVAPPLEGSAVAASAVVSAGLAVGILYMRRSRQRINKPP